MTAPQEKIVVRSVNWLGDAVMTTSALQRLRQARPDAHITILAHEKLVALWKNQPFVDEAMPFTSQESPLDIGRRLRWGNFSSSLILPNSPRAALEMWFGRIPIRIGYSRLWRNVFLTRRIAPRIEEIRMRKRSVREVRALIASGANQRERFPQTSHHVYQYLHLVAEAYGASSTPLPPQIVVLESEVGAFKQRFQVKDSSLPTIGLNPGAEYGPAKRWPMERFIEVAARIQKQIRCRWLIFGGNSDRALAQEISAALVQREPSAEVLNFAGSTSLRELCAAFKMCSVVLTNDTGPMHLAAAIGIPVVVPFGSTSPDLTGPTGGGHHKLIMEEVPCAPCFLRECPIDFRCMTGITVERVVQETLATLSEVH